MNLKYKSYGVKLYIEIDGQGLKISTHWKPLTAACWSQI